MPEVQEPEVLGHWYAGAYVLSQRATPALVKRLRIGLTYDLHNGQNIILVSLNARVINVNWYVKVRVPNGGVTTKVCHSPEQVGSEYRSQLVSGNEVWIKNEAGEIIAISDIGPVLKPT